MSYRILLPQTSLWMNHEGFHWALMRINGINKTMKGIHIQIYYKMWGLLAEIQVSRNLTTHLIAANCYLKCCNYRVYQLWRAHKLVYYIVHTSGRRIQIIISQAFEEHCRSVLRACGVEQPIDWSILVPPFCICFHTCVQAVKKIKCENAQNFDLTHKWYLHFGNCFTFYSSVITFTVNANELNITQQPCLALIKVLVDKVWKPINHHVNKVSNVLTAIIHRQLQSFTRRPLFVWEGLPNQPERWVITRHNLQNV